jgi:hypothetical protein
MGCLLEVFGWICESILGAVFFMTGEVLLYAATLGRHRIQWWEIDDANSASTMLGVAFWAAVIVVIVLVAR